MPTFALAQIDEQQLATMVRLVAPLDDPGLWSGLEKTLVPAKQASELGVVLG